MAFFLWHLCCRTTANEHTLLNRIHFSPTGTICCLCLITHDQVPVSLPSTERRKSQLNVSLTVHHELTIQNYQRDALNIIYSSNIITLLYMFRVSNTHLQEDIVVHMQHMVPSLSIRILVSCWYAAIGRTMVILTLVAVTVPNFSLPSDLINFSSYFVQINKMCLPNIFFFILTIELNIFILKHVKENLQNNLYAIRILSIKILCTSTISLC